MAKRAEEGPMAPAVPAVPSAGETEAAAAGVPASGSAASGAARTASGRASDSAAERSSGAEVGAARGRRQTKVGRVVSNKMNKTVIVVVESSTTHRLYHRYLKKTSRFAAHDEDNRCQIGDQVAIVSSRPLSRTKRWQVREILKRAE
jgi:small subunit ribosomal protein S17